MIKVEKKTVSNITIPEIWTEVGPSDRDLSTTMALNTTMGPQHHIGGTEGPQDDNLNSDLAHYLPFLIWLVFFWHILASFMLLHRWYCLFLKCWIKAFAFFSIFENKQKPTLHLQNIVRENIWIYWEIAEILAVRTHASSPHQKFYIILVFL